MSVPTDPTFGRVQVQEWPTSLDNGGCVIRSGAEQAGLWDNDVQNGIWPRSYTVWIVAVWIALLIIRPWEVLFPSWGSLHIERVYAIFAIAAVFLSGQLRFSPSFQTTGLLLLALGLGVSTACAVDPALAWDCFYVYLTIFAFYFVLLSVVRTPYQLVFLVATYVVVMAAYLAKAQWEYFFHQAGGFAMGVSRLRGISLTSGHPNAVAAITVLSLPFLWFLWRVRDTFTSTWPTFWRRSFPLGLVIYGYLALSSVVMTNSRSGMLGIVVFVVLTALSLGHGRKVLVGAVFGSLLLAVTWIAMPEASKTRLQSSWDPSVGGDSARISAEGRTVGLKQGMEMFRRFPVTGVGPANFQPYRISHLDGTNLVAHNTVAAVLGETGLVGGLAFLVFISGVFVNCRRTKQLAAQQPAVDVQVMKELAVACRNSLVLILFVGMFGDAQRTMELYWVAAFCLLAYTLARASTERYFASEDANWSPGGMD